MRRNPSIKHRFFILFAVVSFLCSFIITNSFAAQALVPQTGQTTGYSAGDDGGLRHGVAWAAAGRFTDNVNGTITDTLTGLIWLQNANCTEILGGVDKSSGHLSWADALTWSNNLASGSCGLNDGSTVGDWRLPNIEELESLVDLQQYNPALPAGHPFGNVHTGGYWSSSTSAGIAADAWTLLIDDGFAAYNSKTSNYDSSYGYTYGYVWPVRGGQATIVTSVVGGNGAITCDSPVVFGAASNCTISPSAGYHLATFTDNGVDKLTSVVDNSYSITKVTAYHAISGTFAPGYAVTYSGNGNSGGSVPTDAGAYSSGATVTVLGNTGTLSKTGYTFAGWNTLANGSGASYSAGVAFTIAGNTTLYAQWTINSYTVSFDNNNGSGTMSSQSANYNVATALTTNSFTKTGYTFSGWNTLANGTGTNYADGASYPFTASATLYAQWMINSYTVSFDNNNGSGTMSSQSANYNVATALTTNSFTKTGYTFAGWNTLANGTGTNYADGASYPFTASVTLYAQWTINSYSVTYDGNGNTAGAVPVDGISHNYNSSVTVLGNTGALVKTGYTFAGWNTAANGSGTGQAVASSFNMGAGNVTLYAQWTINNYTVSFTSNGGSAVASQSVTYNTTVTVPSAPTRAGYSFVGWYSDAGLTSAFAFTTAITADTTLYAKWTINNYTVSFSSNGGSAVASQSVTYNTSATVPAALTRAGYSFAGWYSDAALTSAFAFTTTITGDTTLYAKWTINTYTVSFSSNGGSAVASQSVTYNTTATAPAALTRAGYSFAGWYSDAALTTAFAFTTAITADTALYAKWTGPTVADALKALQAYSGIVSLTPDEKIRYDVAPLAANGVPQGNGVVDIADIIILLRRNVGIGNW